jgi:uncharacterized damage-inducible protein DinB
MYQPDLELLHRTRGETLRLCSAVSQEQSEFAPAQGKWSVGEVLDHLLLAEKFYRAAFARLIELDKSGDRPVVSNGFSEVNTSIAFIPKSLLPLTEIPFTILNMFVPSAVREFMTQFPILPAQNPDMAKPEKGKPVTDLRQALQSSYAETAALFHANPALNYRRMRYRHPLMGDNNALQLLRIVSLHERRHQGQLGDILGSRQFPKVA